MFHFGYATDSLGCTTYRATVSAMQKLECSVYCNRNVLVVSYRTSVFYSFIFSPLSIFLISLSPPLPNFCPLFLFLVSLSFPSLFRSLFSVLINVLWPITPVNSERPRHLFCVSSQAGSGLPGCLIGPRSPSTVTKSL